MISRRSLLHAFLVLFCVAYGVADSPLSLQDAIREAVHANLDLQAVSQNRRMAMADVTTAGLRTNPTLNVIGDILPAPGERFDPGSKYYGASLVMPLDLVGRRGRRLDVASALEGSAREQYRDAVRQLTLRTKLAFYTVLALRDRLELANVNLSRLDAFVRLTRIRAEHQEIPAIDVTRSELTRAQNNEDVQAVRTAYQASLVDLQLLMGRSQPADSLALASDVEDVDPPDSTSLDDAVRFALAHRPDYQALLLQAGSEVANKQLQESLGSFDLSVAADYSRQQYADFYGLSLSIGLPLFNRNQGEVEKSEYRIVQNSAALKSLGASIRAEILKAREEMNTLWEIVRQQRATLLPRAEQTLKTVEFSYRSGNTNLLDYLEAQRSFTEVRISYIDALLRYHISQSTFESAISQEEP